MRATIDKAGRVVIPRVLRERLGLRPGEVELIPDGSGVRIEPLAGEDVVEEGDRLVIPAVGTPIDDDTVQALRDADQR
jgi:AbrB family looped-hinge helix DNA binding protein